MRTIKVFIASSEELRLDRLEFADMIQQLNRILKPRGVEIDPLDNHEKYHCELKNCEMCLVLYWTKFEDQTKDELDTAYSELCAGRNPQKLYVYFKDADDITPELKAFKESFSTKYGHFFCRFENVDTMKLNFLLQFEDYQDKTSEVLLKVRDSRVEVDGQPFVELKNVPFAGNNPEYLQLLKQIESTQARVLKYPDDREFRQELHDLQERRKAMESSLLDTAKLITRLSSTTTSARLTEAMRLFEAGDNKGANAILNFDEISHDAEINAARCDAIDEIKAETLKALESNIEEFKLKIKTLQNTMEKGWIIEVIAIYDKAVAIARDRIASEKFAELLRNYADFLRRNKQYHLVGSLYNEALSIYYNKLNPLKYEYEIAGTLNNLANMHLKMHRYDTAEQEYCEALKIYRRIKIDNPKYINNMIAMVINNLALIYSYTNRLDMAEKNYNEALEIRRWLNKNTLECHDDKIALTMNNLATLHSDMLLFDLAESEYNEVLRIYRQLSNNTGTFDCQVALTLNNLANVHKKKRSFDLAESEYNEALKIYKRLADKSPETYESDMATTLNNLASLYKNTQRLSLAEQKYKEALEIRRRLAKKNSDTYENDIATTLNNLANLHKKMSCFDIAEKEYNEVLEIRQQQVKKRPDAFIDKIAFTLNNLANLHKKIGQLNHAEQEYNKALEIYRHLAKTTNNSHDDMIASILNNLALLHYDIQHFNLAEKEYRESLDIRRKLAKLNPLAFNLALANTLYNIANLHKIISNFDLAESEYIEALAIYRHLREKNIESIDIHIAQTLNNLANLHSSCRSFDSAEKEYQEALEIMLRLSKGDQHFNMGIVDTLYNQAILHANTQRVKLAQQELEQALNIINSTDKPLYENRALDIKLFIEELYKSNHN